MTGAALELRESVQQRTDGLLFYRAPATTTSESVTSFFDDMVRLQTASTKGLLVDARYHVDQDSASRTVIYRRAREVRHLRIAVVTLSRLQRAMVRFLAMATRTNVQCFDSMEEATRWLKS